MPTSFLFYVVLFCMLVCFARIVYLYHICAWYPERTKEGLRFPGTEVTNSCELPCVCWESNLDHLEEHPVLMTTEHRPLHCSDPTLDPQAQQHSQVLEKTAATVTEQAARRQDLQGVGYVVG